MGALPDDKRNVTDEVEVIAPPTDSMAEPTVELAQSQAAPADSRSPDSHATDFDPTINLPTGLSETVDPVLASPSQRRTAAVLHTSVGDYEIERELGRGGMGVVYKARHRQLGRDVALKMILVGTHASDEQVARFYTEAQAVAHLQHPNIVQIFDIGEYQGLPYFSLEFVSGPSLLQKYRGTPPSAEEAARMIETLARAMQYAHEHGVLHRDLKPANILLTEDGVPKISDFGLAKRLEENADTASTRDGTVMGTPSYMSPEQARGEVSRVGPAADQYSLGAMLYELLTGRPPFLAAKPMDAVLQVLRDEPVRPRQLQPKVPVDLETICLKALQKEIGKRYQDCTQLADDLRRFLAKEPILARPITWPERLWRWCRRNPRVASLSAAVLALLLAIPVLSLVFVVRLSREMAATERARLAAVDAEERAEQKAKEEAAARSLAEQKTIEAQEAKVVADANGTLAVNTLYSVVTTIHNEFRDKPDMQSLGQQIHQIAMKGLNQVTGGAEGSALASRARGAAHQRMGDLYLQLGQTEQALAEYKLGLETYDRLLADNPTDDIAKYSVAVMCDKVGDTTHQLEAIAAAARPYFQRALQLREELATLSSYTEPLTAGRVRSTLISSYSRQTSLALMLGDPQQAHLYFQKLQELDNDSPAQSGAAADDKRAQVCLIAGGLCFHRGEFDEARRLYEEALHLSQAAHDRDPLSVPHNRSRASCYGTLGDLQLQQRQVESALQFYQQAFDVHSELAEKNPDSSDAQRDLSLAYYRLGTAHLYAGHIDEARQAYQQCLKLREQWSGGDTRNAFKQVELILALARCDRHPEAAEKAGLLLERVQDDPGMLFFVGCGYALCGATISAGRQLQDLSADELQLRQRYIAQAFVTLRRAIDLGYRDLVALQRDPDLEPLRKEPEFAALLQKIQ